MSTSYPNVLLFNTTSCVVARNRNYALLAGLSNLTVTKRGETTDETRFSGANHRTASNVRESDETRAESFLVAFRQYKQANVKEKSI